MVVLWRLVIALPNSKLLGLDHLILEFHANQKVTCDTTVESSLYYFQREPTKVLDLWHKT